MTERYAIKQRAIVIGGSMSGLFAGLLLRQRGFTVDIYERVESELVRARRRHRGAADRARRRCAGSASIRPISAST